MPPRIVAVALVFVALVVLGCAVPAHAQQSVIADARAASSAGRRADALALLETHLAATPRDADARLIYGLILSWEGRYDEARAQLTLVLDQAPTYLDATVALMNVEWWSGRLEQARVLVNQVLAGSPGHQQAQLVGQRLDARSQPWSLGVSYGYDHFNESRSPWQETAVTLGRQTPVGSILVRGTRSERFGFTDEQVELELYPRFRAGTYAYIGLGFSPDHELFPERRLGVDLYQSLGGGVEVSVGFRRLEFGSVTDIYVGSLTKYVGSWMLTGRVYHVPGMGTADSTSYHGQLRRYFGSSGTSYLGVVYGHGLSREEIRSSADLVDLNTDTIRGEFQADLAGSRLQFSMSGSTSRQERAGRAPLWQTRASVGLQVRF